MAVGDVVCVTERYRDDSVEPAELVCQVGSTKLRYLARCIDDVPEMLRAHGEWMDPVAPTRTGGHGSGRWSNLPTSGLRMYEPGPSVLDGTYPLPRVRRLD